MKTDRNIQCNRGYLVSPDTVLVFVIISLKKKIKGLDMNSDCHYMYIEENSGSFFTA